MFPDRSLRYILLVVLLPVVPCSAKDPKDRKGLTGQKLINSFDGDRKGLAGDIALLGGAYTTHWDENKGNPPKQFKDLERYFDTDEPARLKKNVRENIVFVWNVKYGVKPPDKIILVYERRADKDGNRLAVIGDGKLHFIGDAEFRAALKATKE